MIVAVAAHKGGVGKTTTAVMLAWLLARDGAPTVLIDGDRQGSATTWRREAERYGETWPEALTFERWTEPLTLPPSDRTHVVIDTGPGDPGRVRAAAAVCDLAVVVTTPLPADVAQVGTTVADVEKAGAPLVGVLLNRVRQRTVEAQAVPSDMREDGIPALDTIVPESITRYSRAFGTVPTAHTAAAFIDVLAELQTPVED